jgi:ankyrin repeat protein
MNRKTLVLMTAVLLCAVVIVQADEIHDAVDSNDVARVEALLSGDEALIELLNQAGQTPLHRAAEAGLVRMMGLLLSRVA